MHEFAHGSAQEPESAACLRVLVCFAKTFEPLRPSEFAALEEFWNQLALPPSLSLAGVLAENINVADQLSLIHSEEARERTYTAVYLFAHTGGSCTTKQLEMLGQISELLLISNERQTPLSRIYGDVRELVYPSHNRFIVDPLKRLEKVNNEILKISLQNGVTGAFPLSMRSVAPNVNIFSAQSVMVEAIAHLWGVSMDKDASRLLVANIRGEAGMRIAVQSLMPGTIGINSSQGSQNAFVTTWALGKVTHKYFETDGKMSSKELHDLYVNALLDSGAAFDASRDELAAAVQSRTITLELLSEEFQNGTINSEEYDRKVLGLP